MPFVLCTTLLLLANWTNGGLPVGNTASALNCVAVEPISTELWNNSGRRNRVDVWRVDTADTKWPYTLYSWERVVSAVIKESLEYCHEM